MIKLDIPGFGYIHLEYLVTDFTGTLSVDGIVMPEIKGMLEKISNFLKIYILTADSFGTVERELASCNCEIHILTGKRLDIQKEKFINKLGKQKTIAIGNGNNDKRMLKKARIGIAVCNEEGCSTKTFLSADIFVKSVFDALYLLLNIKRLEATLKF